MLSLSSPSETNSHVGVSGVYAYDYGYNTPAGIECFLSATPPSVSGDNIFFSIMSFSGVGINNHIGAANVYSDKLFCRAGIPLLGAQVRDPLTNELVGRSVNDSADVFAFCDNTDECVALEGSSIPTCYADATVYDVDDFSGSGQDEYCIGDYNVWCPLTFLYDADLDQCYRPPDACYDEVRPDKCNLRERETVFTQVQYLDWLTDLDDCSNYDDPSQACCFVAEIHNITYQYEQPICIYSGGGNSPTNSIGNPC